MATDLITRFIEAAQKHEPDWHFVPVADGLQLMIGTGQYDRSYPVPGEYCTCYPVDVGNDLKSGSFLMLLLEYLEGKGYFKFTLYRSAPGLEAECYAKGPARMIERYGSGPTKTAAVMEAVCQAMEEMGAKEKPTSKPEAG